MVDAMVMDTVLEAPHEIAAPDVARTGLAGPLAFVLDGDLKPDAMDLLRAGKRPRYIYDRFLERNDARLVQPQDVAGDQGALVRGLRRVKKGGRYLSLAAAVHRMPGHFTGLVTAGEGLGIPLALVGRAMGRKTPVYSMFHGHYVESPKFRVAAQILRRLPNFYPLCLSSSLRNLLVDRYGFSPERCHSVEYGTDTAFFRPEPRRLQPGVLPMISSAGTSVRDYGTLLQAAEGLAATIEIDASSLWEDIGASTKGRTMPANVHVGRTAPYVGLRDLLARSEFAVIPLVERSYPAGLSVIGEAMAMGKAVIVTRTAGRGEIITHGETGFYVEPGNAAELRARMQELISQPELARRMGEAARARTVQEFSLDHFCARIEAIIAESQRRLTFGG
ncbi:glycosyltransferase family 4 protein [Roseomonas sp. NAR14]|uniref:Glycosyltransferase family 4 protein n=1 Tax=Roseomonas acroporae TaxID=2937791 RepID=A0A9X1Y9V0_9PROT|nr:glycosyltransferase family 4 protein [Roseomonas acroporae]MCK8786198.1 glycosyltransferase family 4 protein [Roseomonas acroporae]